MPREVPGPGHGLPDRVPGHPDHLHVNVAFTNYSTGHILTKTEAIDGDQGQLARAARERHVVRDGAGARRGREARADPASTRRAARRYVGTKEGLEPLAAVDVTVDADRADRRRRRATRSLKGAELLRARPGAQRVHGADHRRQRDPAAGHRRRRSSSSRRSATTRANDAFTRIDDGKVFRDNGQGSFVSGNAARSSSPAGRRTSASATSAQIIHDPLVREPFLRVFVWTFVFAASTRAPLVRARAVPRDRARQAGAALPAALPLAARHPVRDPGLPVAARLGRASSTTTSGSSTKHPRTSQHPPWLFGGTSTLGASGLGDPRQRLADRRRTSSSSRSARCSRSRGADRGGAGRRRRRAGRSSAG